MSYGITNRHGQVGPAAVSSILARAAGVGIDTLDTAAAYGDCEAVLGRVGVAGWRVVSKVPPLPESAVDPAVWVLESVERSLRAWIFHVSMGFAPPMLRLARSHGDVIYDALVEARRRGWCRKIGVSVYGPATSQLYCKDFKLISCSRPLAWQIAGWRGPVGWAASITLVLKPTCAPFTCRAYYWHPRRSDRPGFRAGSNFGIRGTSGCNGRMSRR